MSGRASTPVFRPSALAAYRSGSRQPLPDGGFKQPVWPALLLVILVLTGGLFLALVTVPRVVRGAVVGTSGPYLVVLVEGAPDPLVEAGAPVSVIRTHAPPAPGRVVRAETLGDRSGLQRWQLPGSVPLPATVVLLGKVSDGAWDEAPQQEQVTISAAEVSVLHAVLGG